MQDVPGFDIEREVGHGGMGRVFAARRIADAREVALKRLPPKVEREAAWRTQLLHEAEATRRAAVVEPGAVGLLDVVLSDLGSPVLVMEWIPGITLEDLRHVGLRRRAALAYLVRLARLVARLHDRGLVHGDLKPANVMIVGTRVRLVDFGLAHDATEAVPPMAQIRGTPGYMAPEQYLGAGSTPCTDVFALGVILYELVAGQALRAFDHTAAPTVNARAGHPHVPLGWLCPDADPELIELADAALDDDRTCRPTAAAFAARLAAAA